MTIFTKRTGVVSALLLATVSIVSGAPFTFSTGDPNGLIATATRPASSGKIEIESADDFILNSGVRLTGGTFTGLLTNGATASDIGNVRVEIYRVFPKDSTDPPSGKVPTRTNSPSDIALEERDVASADLSFTANLMGSFTAQNSVVNGINPIPNQTTTGEGPVTGSEVRINFILLSPITLLADHYFFVPQVEVNGAAQFLWLSGQRPTSPPFAPDLQSWIRNENLAPDWLRIGTDIVGGSPAPTFNAAFSLNGETVPEPSNVLSMVSGLLILTGIAKRRLSA